MLVPWEREREGNAEAERAVSFMHCMARVVSTASIGRLHG
jgi:hypothetical protein